MTLDEREDIEDSEGKREDSDALPKLPSVPGMDDWVSPPAVSSSGTGVRPDFDDDSRNSPAIVVPRKNVESSGINDEDEGTDVLRGRNFGGYELVQKIGQGGMGLVYKAKQISLDRTVAIKILSKALSENDEFIKRFEREAKSIGRIHHSNLVAVYDFGRVDGLYYMVTEFIEGTNLAKLINDRLVIPAEELVPLIIHCLLGLGHVATHNIVHRDIKPDNILINTEGVAKLADFGLAKDVSNDTDLTAVGLAMGTPAYMSPEQCMGRKLDVRSDIYALGVTAYFALTGEKPFTGQSSFEIMTKQREHMPPAPSQLNPRLPKEISNLVMRMIAKNPHDRFRDTTECREAWLEAGQHIGIMPAISRSGEYKFSASELAKLHQPPAEIAAPNESVNSSTGSLPAMQNGLPNLQAVSMPPAPVMEAPASVPQEPAKISTEREVRRSTTERKSVRGSSPVSEVITCPKCGMLNRANSRRCQRCEVSFIDEPMKDAATQEAEAQRLLDQGNFRAAAERFTTLADNTEDRRVRSVLRSRAREARMRESQGATSEVLTRSRAMVDRGDYRGGLDVLARHLRGLRDGNTSGDDLESSIVTEIASVRSHIGGRRRLKVIVIVMVLATVVVGLCYWLWSQGKLPGSEYLLPPSPSASLLTVPPVDHAAAAVSVAPLAPAAQPDPSTVTTGGAP